MTLTKRISELVAALCTGVPERESCIQLGFLATVTGAPIYLYGRSGSGKSLIADRLAASYKNARVLKIGRRQEDFPTKLNGFDVIVFKNINIQDDELKENVHSAIHGRENASMILIGDQRPESTLSRLEITDHIVLTISLPERLSSKALCAILQDQTKNKEIHVPMGLALSQEELKQWNSEIQNITLSSDTLEIIGKLAELCDQNDVYVPIRKWIAFTNIIKAIAFFNGRTETRFTDAFFLGAPIWGKNSANTAIAENFCSMVESVLLKDLPEVLKQPYNAAATYSKVKTLLHSSNNLYETKMFNNEPCLSYRITIAGEPAPLYVPLRYMETDEDFNPFNELKQVETRVRCNYHGTSSCTISIDSSVKGVGLRSSMQRNSANPGKFEDFATLPSYILRENDPEVAAQKKARLDELKKEIAEQMDHQTKLLIALRDLYRNNKAYRDDLFCNTEIFDKLQTNLRNIFDSITAVATKIKETHELFNETAK